MAINRIRAEEMPRFLINLPRGPVLPERQELRVATPGTEFVDFPQTPEDLNDDYQYNNAFNLVIILPKVRRRLCPYQLRRIVRRCLKWALVVDSEVRE